MGSRGETFRSRNTVYPPYIIFNTMTVALSGPMMGLSYYCSNILES